MNRPPYVRDITVYELAPVVLFGRSCFRRENVDDRQQSQQETQLRPDAAHARWAAKGKEQRLREGQVWGDVNGSGCV